MLRGGSSWSKQATETSVEAMIQSAEQFVLENDFPTALIWYKKASDVKWYSIAANLGYNMAKIKVDILSGEYWQNS